MYTLALILRAPFLRVRSGAQIKLRTQKIGGVEVNLYSPECCYIMF